MNFLLKKGATYTLLTNYIIVQIRIMSIIACFFLDDTVELSEYIGIKGCWMTEMFG